MSEAIKITFAGKTNVGKSSIVTRFSRDNLPQMYPTVGAAFVRKVINKNNKIINMDIWDTAGQERYQALSAFYFRQCAYCILVFDLTDINSFKDIHKWKQLCYDANYTNGSQPIYFLVGNKSDYKIKIVPEHEIKLFCEQNQITQYFETSAYNGEGIEILFSALVDHIQNNYIQDLIYLRSPDVTIHFPEQMTDKCSC